MRFLIKLVKGVALYIAILSAVTFSAAVIGCLFLPNGHVRYLLDPEALLTFLWVTRAGLKVSIFFIATSIFMMLADNGALGRKWFKRPHSGARPHMPEAGRLIGSGRLFQTDSLVG